MRVFVKPPNGMSRAMWRVSRALEQHAPAGVEVVQSADDADLLVHHVIGLEAVDYMPDRPCVVIQYCCNSVDRKPWLPLWERSLLVWSYYDLAASMPDGTAFLHTPLGIDPIFRRAARQEMRPFSSREVGVLTTGFINGESQEAIEEIQRVGQALSLGRSVHLGPYPKGIRAPLELDLATNITDPELVDLYGRSKFVGAMRFLEGFEMPAVEGLALGVRPVVFDREETRKWFHGHAIFVPECDGARLEDHLYTALKAGGLEVTEEERGLALLKFDWRWIVPTFWDAVLNEWRKE